MSAGAQPEQPVASTLRSRLDTSRAAPSDPCGGREPSEARRSVLEPLSPELALVDPDLAARARAALRQTALPSDTGRRVPRYVERRQSDAGPPAAIDVRTRRRAAVVVALACVVAFTAAGVAGAKRVRGGDESADAPAGPVRVPAVSGRDEAEPSPTSKRPRAQSAPTRSTTPPAPGRPSGAPISAARTFAWAAVPGARHYRVELFRRGSRILDRRTRAARLVLPARWRHRGRRMALRPGRYWWRVRPAFGAAPRVRYGRPVVSAALVISADRS